MKNDIDIKPSGITRILLNQEEKQAGELKSIMKALSNRKILIEKSGYLFNSSIKDNCLCIGILPYFVNGERTHHYDIELPVQGKCILYGFINSNTMLALLFKPDKETYYNGFQPEMAEVFRDNYVRLARFFIENGFPGKFELDLVTKCLFEEANMFTDVPSTVKELAMQKTSSENR
jgi:hypothetical protein